MLANYGYKDGSGDFFITIDTDKCTGCGDCIKVCPANVLEMITDESDPFREIPVVAVTDQHRKKIKYSCAPCKPARPNPDIFGGQAGHKPAGSPAEREKPTLPCMNACQPNAIVHSW